MYTITKSLCCTPEMNKILCQLYLSKKKMKQISWGRCLGTMQIVCFSSNFCPLILASILDLACNSYIVVWFQCWFSTSLFPFPFINWKSAVRRAVASCGLFYPRPQSFWGGEGGSWRKWGSDLGWAYFQACGLGILQREEDPLGIANGDLVSQAWRSNYNL